MPSETIDTKDLLRRLDVALRNGGEVDLALVKEAREHLGALDNVHRRVQAAVKQQMECTNLTPGGHTCWLCGPCLARFYDAVVL
jgi:hypothetical protein